MHETQLWQLGFFMPCAKQGAGRRFAPRAIRLLNPDLRKSCLFVRLIVFNRLEKPMYRDPVQSLVPQSSPADAVATRPLRVGMIGIGTVGAGTFRVLARNQADIAGRAGRGIKLVMVCARSLARAMSVVGTELAVVQAGIPAVIPTEACYLGWQESLQLLALLVEAEIPG